MWYWPKDRHTDQWISTERPRNKPTQIQSNDFDKGAKMFNKERTVFSTNGGGKMYIHMQNNRSGLPLHMILTPNGSNKTLNRNKGGKAACHWTEQ